MAIRNCKDTSKAVKTGKKSLRPRTLVGGYVCPGEEAGAMVLTDPAEWVLTQREIWSWNVG